MAHHPQSFALVILSIVNTLKSVKAAPWAALSIASKKNIANGKLRNFQEVLEKTHTCVLRNFQPTNYLLLWIELKQIATSNYDASGHVPDKLEIGAMGIFSHSFCLRTEYFAFCKKIQNDTDYKF